MKKKVIGIVLALALAAMCFGCGEVQYEEVAEADYASTIASFSDVATEIEAGKSFGYEITAKTKLTDTDATTGESSTSEGTATSKFVFDAEGEVTVEMSMSGSADGEEVTASIYVDGEYFYANLSGELASMFGSAEGELKAKFPVDSTYSSMLGGLVEAQNMLPSLISNILETDASEIAKLEISGKEGADRWLKITVDMGEDAPEGAESYAELKVDKDNKFQSLKVVLREDENNYMEYEMKRFSGTITVPDADSYTEFTPPASQG